MWTTDSSLAHPVRVQRIKVSTSPTGPALLRILPHVLLQEVTPLSGTTL